MLRIVDASARRGAAYARNAGAAAARGSALLVLRCRRRDGGGISGSDGASAAAHEFVACRYDFARLNTSWLAPRRASDGQGSGLAGGYCHPTLPYAGRRRAGDSAKRARSGRTASTCTLKRWPARRTRTTASACSWPARHSCSCSDAMMHVRFRDTVSGVFAQAWAWAESGAHVQRRYAASPATQSAAGTHTISRDTSCGNWCECGHEQIRRMDLAGGLV